MWITTANWRYLKTRVLRPYFGPILSILCVVISIGCIAAGFYLLAAVTAGANLITTRSAIQRSKKKNSLAGDR
jgi:hypothetical protein